MAQKRAETSIM